MTTAMVLDSSTHVTLGQIASELADLHPQLSGSPDACVRDVTQDSRRAKPGSLFVARAGEHTSGARFASDAVARGAVAVLCDSDVELSGLSVPTLRVDQLAVAAARAAELVHGLPSQLMDVIAITGTNGKTSVAYLLEALLRGCGARPARLGTLGYRFELDREATTLTTPQSDELSQFAARAVRGGASHLVMEASSIALEQQRMAGMKIKVAAFTNLSQDHLDYHEDMQHYGQAKERLFFDLNPEFSVICIDSGFGARLADRLADAGKSVVRVASDPQAGTAEIVALTATSSLNGVWVELQVGNQRFSVASPLLGMHNVQNLCVAVGVAWALGYSLPSVVASLATAASAPGRLEVCSSEADDISVLVDYAHTPDALERALTTLRAITPGRLTCVFGCGGDRDRGKRPLMGAVASRLADCIWITNDNPRTEDPATIARAIAEGLDRGHVRSELCLDREEAIRQAIAQAETGGTLLIAGKGHETYQILGDQRRHFDDREVAQSALEQRRRRGAGVG